MEEWRVNVLFPVLQRTLEQKTRPRKLEEKLWTEQWTQRTVHITQCSYPLQWLLTSGVVGGLVLPPVSHGPVHIEHNHCCKLSALFGLHFRDTAVCTLPRAQKYSSMCTTIFTFSCVLFCFRVQCEFQSAVCRVLNSVTVQYNVQSVSETSSVHIVMCTPGCTHTQSTTTCLQSHP